MSWVLFERAGGALAYLLARTPASPAFVTLMSCAVGITGAAVLATATDPGDVFLAGGLLLLSYTLDCADGQLARATHRTSARGAWLDVASDAVVVSFVTSALVLALVSGSSTPLLGLFVAGAYGASRTVSLLTSARVQMESGGLALSGVTHALRVGYVAAIDTPVSYVTLCLCRLSPDLLVVVMSAVTVLTLAQTVVSAAHHFASAPASEHGA